MRTEEPSEICHSLPESSVKVDANRHFRLELPNRQHCTSVALGLTLPLETARVPDLGRKQFQVGGINAPIPEPWLPFRTAFLRHPWLIR
jgi:hypothetical protein